MTDLRFLLFPAALFAYYMICWWIAGRDPKIKNVTPQYEPPQGISPGVARYVLTGGSDGTTLAAVLANLAAKRVISIIPEGKGYRVNLLSKTAPVLPEEATLIKTLLLADVPVEAYPMTSTAKIGAPSSQQSGKESASFYVRLSASASDQPSSEATAGEVVLDPRNQAAIRMSLDAIQSAFRENLQGFYFRWNFRFVLAGMAATFLCAFATSFSLDTPQGSPVFLTFWLLMFTSIAGIVMSGVFMSKPTHPTAAQQVQRFLLPIIFFFLPGFLIYEFALPAAHGFVLALLISVALNSIFMVLMRAPTAEGRRLLEQLAGFREFLLRVEQDRLDRLNTPAQKAELMNRFLPYAIALGVREGWGDTMAATFSNAVVER